MAVNFVSKLIYALRERLGWCPKPPTTKDAILMKMALYKLKTGILYFEKPCAAWGILIYPFIFWSGAILLIIFPSWGGWKLGLYPPLQEAILPLFMWLVFLGSICPIIPLQAIPSIFKRKILLTTGGIQVEYGFYGDRIPIHDIKSIELVEKPLLSYRPPWSLRKRRLCYGVVKTDGAKWYVFSGRRTYIKINKRNGDAVCIGVENPEEFMNRWKVLQSQQGSSAEISQRVCADCGKPISYGEGWIEKENKPYHLECWTSKRNLFSEAKRIK